MFNTIWRVEKVFVEKREKHFVILILNIFNNSQYHPKSAMEQADNIHTRHFSHTRVRIPPLVGKQRRVIIVFCILINTKLLFDKTTSIFPNKTLR